MDLINRGVEQLIKIEEQINLEPINLILIVVVPKQMQKSIKEKSFSGKENLKIYIIEEEIITTPAYR